MVHSGRDLSPLPAAYLCTSHLNSASLSSFQNSDSKSHCRAHLMGVSFKRVKEGQEAEWDTKKVGLGQIQRKDQEHEV